jgi:hypothetical protein
VRPEIRSAPLLPASALRAEPSAPLRTSPPPQDSVGEVRSGADGKSRTKSKSTTTVKVKVKVKIKNTEPCGHSSPGRGNHRGTLPHSRQGSPQVPPHPPAARHDYALRSRVRCRLCQRRMCGITRTSSRYYTGDADALHTYYLCTHNPANPRHAALRPDHPRTVSVRENDLLEVVRQFFAERVFGPERHALLREQLPASEAEAAAQRAADRAALTKELARIDIAQRNQILQIDGLSPDPADKAAQAMRARCYQRFAELHTERENIEAEIHEIDGTPARDDHAELLTGIPLLAANLAQMPERNPGRPLPGIRHTVALQQGHAPSHHLGNHHRQHTPSGRRHHHRRRPRPRTRHHQPSRTRTGPRQPCRFRFGTAPYIAANPP